MVQSSGRLENSFKRPDKVSTIIKSHKVSFKLQTLKHKKILRNSTGVFRTNISLTNGPDKTANNIEAIPIMDTYYFNDNNVFVRPFTFNDDLTAIPAITYIQDNTGAAIQDNDGNNILAN